VGKTMTNVGHFHDIEAQIIRLRQDGRLNFFSLILAAPILFSCGFFLSLFYFFIALIGYLDEFELLKLPLALSASHTHPSCRKSCAVASRNSSMSERTAFGVREIDQQLI
jgi:hypothetical protein